MWSDTLADDTATLSDTRQGGQTPLDVNPKLMHDIQALLSRLISKANQLLGNYTTNLAECWMHIRSKFDGGKSDQQITKWVMGASLHGSWFAAKPGALQPGLG